MDCEEVDRLSKLPDNVIYKILSYLDFLYCIRLSVLSCRWRSIRSSLPILNFPCEQPSWRPYYHEFVNDVLSSAAGHDVSCVSMDLSRVWEPELCLLRILEYAFSHNVQQLSINIGDSIQFSPYHLRCKSLKHLTLIETSIINSYSGWDLPALTTLHLKDVQLHNCCTSIAMCHNLKNLTLERCQVFEPRNPNITISNSQLVSLTLKNVAWSSEVYFINVNTPRLQNLIYVDTDTPKDFSVKELTISARHLTLLRIKASYFPELILDGGFPSLEKLDLCICYPQNTNVVDTIFQRLQSVKSLTLSLEIVELLSTSEQVISHQPSPFPSLKSLKIYPSSRCLKVSHSYVVNTSRLETILEILETQPDEEQEAMKLKLSAQVTNYLLGTSSNVTLTIISHEEARAIKITKVAYRLMANLQERLEKTEANMETLADHSYRREDFFMHSVMPPGDTKCIFNKLHNIELLLTKVLASKRLEMQKCYSRLCAETKTVVNKMTVNMKNQCDIQHRIVCGYLDDKIAMY